MEYNALFYFVAAIIPMVIGAVWYHPKVFGNAWMKASGVTEEQIQGGNMPLIFGLAYVFSLILAFGMTGIVIHQSGIDSLFTMDIMAGDEEITTMVESLHATYGDKHRHFGHGALHGGIAAILLALPLLGTIALFERRKWKYVAIHTGYWFVAMSLMGGVICQFV